MVNLNYLNDVIIPRQSKANANNSEMGAANYYILRN